MKFIIFHKCKGKHQTGKFVSSVLWEGT